MKSRKVNWIFSVVVVLAAALAVLTFCLHKENRPFADFSPNDITSIEFQGRIQQNGEWVAWTYELSGEEQTELLGLLSQVVIYQESPPEGILGAPSRMFTLKTSSGELLSVGVSQSYLFVDDVRYEAETETCLAVSEFYNAIQEEQRALHGTE